MSTRDRVENVLEIQLQQYKLSETPQTLLLVLKLKKLIKNQKNIKVSDSHMTDDIISSSSGSSIGSK